MYVQECVGEWKWVSVHVCMMGPRLNGKLGHHGGPFVPEWRLFPTDVWCGFFFFLEEAEVLFCFQMTCRQKTSVLFSRQHEQIAMAQRRRTNNTHTHTHADIWVFSLGDADEEGIDVSSRCFVLRGGRHAPQNRSPPCVWRQGISSSWSPSNEACLMWGPNYRTGA